MKNQNLISRQLDDGIDFSSEPLFFAIVIQVTIAS